MTKVSIGILSYNEARSLPTIVERLFETMQTLSDVEFCPVIINNGSKDATESVIDNLKVRYPTLRSTTVTVNQGYGFGVRAGLAVLDGDVVGYMWGDNQFDAKIVSEMVQLFQTHAQYHLVKTYRAKRYDGAWRLVISRIYQILFRLLYGSIVRDINAGPKLFRREFLGAILPLQSNDWFVDAEIMIKSTRLLKREEMIEVPMTFFPRPFGKSNVHLLTCFEFVYNLIAYRFKK